MLEQPAAQRLELGGAVVVVHVLGEVRHGIDQAVGRQVAAFDQVAQQVRLTVTAKGTVGAALTEGVAAESSGPVMDLKLAVDRPFIMRVLDTRTGFPLFFAIVNDPADLPD